MMTTLLRNAILAAAARDEVEQFMRDSRWSRALVARFVAGDRLEDALAAATRLHGQDLAATLDRLGENVVTAGEAHGAVESYSETLREMAARGLDPNISVKLTMLGLEIGDDVAYDNMLTLLEAARTVDGFVRIDMEGSVYTERTLAIAEALHARAPGLVGTVIQAYLHRSDRDLERLIHLKMRVRLVKGAYAEPADTSRHAILVPGPDAGLPRSGVAPGALVRPGRSCGRRARVPVGRVWCVM